MSYKIYLIFIAPFVISCYRDDASRNKIIFNDSAELVQDSLISMINLLDKLPKEEMVNYFIDRHGYLFINNSKKVLYSNAATDLDLRKDFVFSRFSEKEISSFFRLIAFLKENYVCDAHFEGSIGQFMFLYKEVSGELNISNLRAILVVSDEFLEDGKFKKHYQVLDKKDQIKLVASKGVVN